MKTCRTNNVRLCLTLALVVTPWITTAENAESELSDAQASPAREQERGRASPPAERPRLDGRNAAPASGRPKSDDMQRRGSAAMGGKGFRMPDFSEFDRDANGVVDREEFSAAREARIEERIREERRLRNQNDAPAFGDIDSNGDGLLSPEEFLRHQEQNRRRWERPT